MQSKISTTYDRDHNHPKITQPAAGVSFILAVIASNFHILCDCDPIHDPSERRIALMDAVSMVTEGKHPFAGLAPGATSERVEGVGANARRRVRR